VLFVVVLLDMLAIFPDVIILPVCCTVVDVWKLALTLPGVWMMKFSLVMVALTSLVQEWHMLWVNDQPRGLST